MRSVMTHGTTWMALGRATALGFAIAAFSGSAGAWVAAPPLPGARPETVGLSSARLRHMNDFFRIQAQRHEASGYVLMVARDGRLVDSAAIGERDLRKHL
ncbi:MAG: hypothetical protein KGL34_07255, partial [Gammaproteobacteria bacterium]|nr:hypothetical protein [Gammaproteobacteria bacterium]